MKVDPTLTAAAVPKVRLFSAGGEIAVEAEIVDAANAKIAVVQIPQVLLDAALSRFRKELDECGLSKIPNHFSFSLSGRLLETEEEDTVKLSDCIVQPPEFRNKTIQETFVGTMPRIPIFQQGSKVHETPADVDEHPEDVNEPDCFGRTPLQECARTGDIETAQKLLASGAHIIATDQRGQNSFHTAAAAGHIRILELFKSHAETIPGMNFKMMVLDSVDLSGRTALLLALQARRRDAAKLLLQWRANDLAIDKHGSSTATLMAKVGLDIISAVRADDADLVRLHIARGTEYVAQPPMMTSPQHDCASLGHVSCLSLLLDAGWEHSVKDSAMQTPLHIAVTQGSLRTAKILVDAGAQISAVDRSLRNVIHRLAANAKAPPDLVDYILGLAKTEELSIVDKDNHTSLHTAAAAGSFYCLSSLLNLGLDPNCENLKLRLGVSYLSPVTVAYVAGKGECVKLLIEKGAKLDENHGGLSLLRIAVQRGDAPMVQNILGEAKDHIFAVDNTDLIISAAKEGHTLIATLLLAAGWVCDEVDSVGQSAVRHAAALNNETLVSVCLPAVRDKKYIKFCFSEACSTDASAAAISILKFLGVKFTREAVMVACRSGAKNTLTAIVSLVSPSIYYVDEIDMKENFQCRDWFSGFYSNSANAQCFECLSLSPLVACLHAAPSLNNTKFEDTALELINLVDSNWPLILRSSCSNGRSPIHLACRASMWRLAMEISKLDPSCLNIFEQQKSPLQICITAGEAAAECVSLMISLGAPLLTPTPCGMSLLKFARVRHNENAVKKIEARLGDLLSEIKKDVSIFEPSVCASASSLKKEERNGKDAAKRFVSVKVEIDWEEGGDTAPIVEGPDGLCACGYCGRRFTRDRIETHRVACKTASKPRTPKRMTSAPCAPCAPSPSLADNSNSENVPPVGEDGLSECAKCLRSFFPKVLKIHSTACKGRPAAPPSSNPNLNSPSPPSESDAFLIPQISKPNIPADETPAGGSGAATEVKREIYTETERIVLEDKRIACEKCGRGFAQERIDKHAIACKGDKPRRNFASQGAAAPSL